MSAFSGKNRPPAPVHYSGLNVGTSQFDLPVPIFWGLRRIATNAIWYNGFVKRPVSGKGKGGGGKSAQQSYDYKAAVMLGLCEGPVSEITLIWANGSTTTTTTLSALNMIFSAGASNAGVWSYLTTNYPSQAIAYRLTAYVASPLLDLGSSATIPDNQFECLRTATISFAVGASPTTTFIPWSGTAPANYASYAGVGLVMLTGAAATETSTVTAASASGLTISPALSTTPAAGDAFGLGFAYTHFQAHGGWINPNSYIQSGAVDCLPSDIVTDFLTNAQYGLGFGAADLGSISQYASYCQAQGIFFSPLLNSPEKATSIVDRWAKMSNSWIYWSGTQLQFVPLADGPLTGNGATFTPQNDVAYALTLADFIAEAGAGAGPVKVTRRDPADCYNRTILNITDRTLGYISNPFEWKDQTLVDTFGVRDNANVQADEICDPGVGRVVVQLLGKRAAYIRNTYSFKTSYRFILCLPGTVLTLTEPNIGLDAVRVRVTKVSEDDKGQLAFECEEFPGTTATYVAPVTAPAVGFAGTLPDLYASPGNVNTPAVIEPNSAYTGGTPKLIVAASGGAFWGGCTVNVSFDGVNYSQVGVITSAARQGTLTAALAAYAGTNPDTTDTLAVDCTESLGTPNTAVTNADAQALRSLALIAAQPTGSPAVIPNDGELLAFGAVAATGTYTANLTYLERGQYGTAAGAHGIGDQFTVIDVAGVDGTTVAFDLPAQYVGQTVYLKLASHNLFGLSAQDLSTCTEYSYTPTGAGYGTASGGVPAAPTGLAASPGSSSVALSWNANAAADNVTAYDLYRAAGTGASFSSAGLIWSGTALAYTDTGAATPSTGYTYFLKATNAAGSSSATAGVNATTTSGGGGTTTTTATASANPYDVGVPPAINWTIDLTNSTGAALLVELPSSGIVSGQAITVVDSGGNAGTHTITLRNGLTTVTTISTNGGSATVYAAYTGGALYWYT